MAEHKPKSKSLRWWGFALTDEDRRERMKHQSFHEPPKECPGRDGHSRCGSKQFTHLVLRHAGIERLRCSEGHTIARALDESTPWLLETT